MVLLAAVKPAEPLLISPAPWMTVTTKLKRLLVKKKVPLRLQVIQQLSNGYSKQWNRKKLTAILNGLMAVFFCIHQISLKTFAKNMTLRAGQASTPVGWK